MDGFIMENPIKKEWFGGTTIFGYIHIPPEHTPDPAATVYVSDFLFFGERLQPTGKLRFKMNNGE